MANRQQFWFVSTARDQRNSGGGGVRKLMEELKQRFPLGLEYDVALDTTAAVTEGIHDIYKTLFEAMILVIVVVFIFLQGWRPP